MNVGGVSGTFVFTISNTGDATLEISGLTHSGPGFSATPAVLSIPAGGSTSLTTEYTPSGSGPALDNVTISTNATNGNFIVLLLGSANNAPVYDPALAAEYTAPAFVAFSLLASATDPEGDVLNWSISSSPALPVGATFDATTGALTWTPSPSDAGNYAVTITVSDGAASTPATFALHVTAANHPPVANPGIRYEGATGVPVTFDGSRSSDPDAGQTLRFAWEFGDGSSGVGATPSHAYASAGIYLVSLTVTDNGTPPLSGTALTGATIRDFIPITIVQRLGDSGTIRTAGNSGFRGNNLNNFGIECYVRPLTDIDQTSIKISTTYPNAGTVKEVSVATRRDGLNIGDINQNLFYDLDFTVPSNLARPLLLHVPNDAMVTLVFTAKTLADTVPIRGTIDLRKKGPSSTVSLAGQLSSTASPNPFKPETSIRYTVPGAGPVAIRVFSVSGQLVRSLREEFATPGAYEVRWNGRDDHGGTVSSGIYFVSVRQGTESSTSRVVLAR